MEFKLRVDCIHSDKNTDERIEIVKKFNAGDIWVLICTDLMVIYIFSSYYRLVVLISKK
jgi:superfamily II DNA/RNA helicase